MIQQVHKQQNNKRNEKKTNGTNISTYNEALPSQIGS